MEKYLVDFAYMAQGIVEVEASSDKEAYEKVYNSVKDGTRVLANETHNGTVRKVNPESMQEIKASLFFKGIGG